MKKKKKEEIFYTGQESNILNSLNFSYKTFIDFSSFNKNSKAFLQ